MTDLDGPSPEEHPRPSHIPDIEYEDEPPGSYLGEFRIGWWKIAWSVVNVVLVAAIGASGETGGTLEGATPLSVAWDLLLASCILSLCVTLWLSIVSRLEGGKLPVAACFVLDAVSLVLRFCL